MRFGHANGANAATVLDLLPVWWFLVVQRQDGPVAIGNSNTRSPSQGQRQWARAGPVLTSSLLVHMFECRTNLPACLPVWASVYSCWSLRQGDATSSNVNHADPANTRDSSETIAAIHARHSAERKVMAGATSTEHCH